MENIREYNIRLEKPADWQEVENLTREAFWNVYRPGCLEHFVLNRYRSNPDFIPELDFVMETGGRIIGHVMYSRAEPKDDPEGFERYEAAFPAKEKHFPEGQLPQFCQSCGMPITSDDVCGTNADGSANFDYCKYCYQDGEFIDKVSMEEYIEMCSQFGAQAGMTNEQMKEHCRMLFPMLKRWKRK